MIQPPKMSPVGFASAGIGTTRRTGSRSRGSCTDSVGALCSVSRIQLFVLRPVLLEDTGALELERRCEETILDGPRFEEQRRPPHLRVAGKRLDLRVDPLEH